MEVRPGWAGKRRESKSGRHYSVNMDIRRYSCAYYMWPLNMYITRPKLFKISTNALTNRGE